MTLAAVNDSLQKEIEKLQNTSNGNQTPKGKKRKKNGQTRLVQIVKRRNDKERYHDLLL